MSNTAYVTVKRARFDSISGYVNIPYGTRLFSDGNFLFHNGSPICTVTSKNAHDHFSIDEDGNGQIRGALVSAIKTRLERKDKSYQERWDMVWGDTLCQRYKRPEHDDYWLWNHDFYNADIADLKYIAKLVGAKEAR